MFFMLFTTQAQNYALSFSNQNQTAKVPPTTVLELAGPLTIEAWIYPTSWKSAVYQGCIINKEGINFQGYMLRCGANGTLNFNIGTGSTWKELNSASGTLVLNTWQHVAGVFDGTQLKIYVNGVQVGSTLSYTGAVATNDTIPLEIGRSHLYHDRNFPGKIDEVRVWNMALSASDITANYNATLTSAHPNYANLVAYYEMDNINTDTDSDGDLDLVATVGPTGEVLSAPYGPACNGLFTSSAPSGSTSIEAYQSSTSPASLGGTNQHILRIAVDAFTDVTLSQIVFQTNGTTSTSDILNARVWYTGSNSNFSPTTQFGTAIATPPGANADMTFTGTQVISCGRSYLWLTYDINPNATLTNLVDGKFVNAVIDGNTMTPVTTEPTGAREIEATCQHTLQISALYGGGWYGGLVDVNVNGSPVLTGIGSTFTTGYGPMSFNFDAGSGDVITIVRTADGTSSSYMRVAVLDGNGTTVLASVNPTTAGVTTTGYCGGIVYTNAATSITAYSAQLNGSFANCLPVESGFRYKQTAATDWTFVQDNNNPMFYDAQGLIPATNYHYQAYAIVGTDTLWGSTINFATICVPFTIPFAESFNSTTIPMCWTNSSSNSFDFVTSGSNPTASPFFGSAMARFNGWSYSSGAIGYLSTPAFANLTTGQEVRFWFYREDYNNTYTGNLKVYANNTNNPINGVLLLTIPRVYSQTPAEATAGWYEYVAIIPADTFTNIIFQATSDWYGSMFLDEVTINFPATCPQPPATSLSVYNISNTNATANWMRGGIETQWEVAYKTAAETSWTVETAYDTTYLIQNLIPATTYQVKARAVCAPGDESLYTFEKTFTTLCDPISTLPIIENCETTALNELPLCFSKKVSGNAYVRVENYSGNKVVCLNPGATTNDCYLVFPALTEPVNNIRIQFKYIGGDNHLFRIGYFTDPNDASTFQLIHSPSISGSGTWKTFDIISNNSMTGNEKIAIRLEMPSGSYVYLDSITVSLQPQCVEPNSVVTDNVGINDITVSWITSASSSNIEYKESSSSTWTLIPSVTSPYTIPGLLSNTSYDIHVQSVCDGGILSNWSSTISATTQCDLISTLPYVENFETTAVNEIPTCYKKIQSGSATIKVYDLTSEHPEAGKVLQMDFSYSNSGNCYIILPKFSAPVNTLKVGFKYYGGSDNHKFGYITDPNDPSTFVELSSVNIPADAGWFFVNLITNNLMTGNERIAIRYNPSGSWHNNRYDSLTVDIMPSCVPPFDLTALPTNNSVLINWTPAPNTTPIDYTLEYKESSATTWTTLNNVTPPYTLPGLNQNTTYQYRVQANCSTTETSDFTNPSSFTTPALAPVPYLESFMTTNTPVGYSISGFSIGSTRGVTGNPANNIYKNLYSSATTGNFSTINLGPLSTNMVLAFEYKLSLYTSPYDVVPVNSGNFIVAISTDWGVTYTNIDTVDNNGLAGYQNYTLDLSAYDTQIIKIKIIGNWNSDDYDLGIDNIYVGPAITCVHPSQLVVNTPTTSSLNLGWTENGTATEWQIEYGPEGFTQGTGTYIGTTTNPVTIPSLSPATIYDFYVRAICSVGDTSIWSAKATGATECVSYVLPFSENFTSSSFPICWSQSYSGTLTSNRWSVSTGTNAGGTPNQMICNYQSGNGISRLITPAIDFTGIANPVLSFKHFYDDYAAGATLKIQSSSDLVNWTDQPFTISSGSGSVGPVTVNVNLTLTSGINYIAWVIDGNHYQINYWYIDDVTISDVVITCTTPTNLAVSAITSSTATATWTAGGTETQWELSYKPTASSIWNSVFVSAPTHNFSTLTAATAYDVKVRAICAVGDTSAYSSVVNYTTATPPCNMPTNVQVPSAGITDQTAMVTWTAGGTETQWQVEYKLVSSVNWTTMSPSTSTNQLIQALQSNSTYEVRVKALCGTGNESPFTTPVQFTTTGATTFIITASAIGSGTITPTGAVTVTAGADQLFTFSPATGNIVVSLLVDNQNTPFTNNQYEFTNVLANHTIVVEFGVGIEDHTISNLVSLYPNPTSSIIELKINQTQLKVRECQLYDIYGKLIKVIIVSEENTKIDVSDYASGVYFVKMNTEMGVITKKFVKK